MRLKILFFFFPIISFLLKNQIIAKETELDKIKNVIKSMIEINTYQVIPIFFFKFRKIKMGFLNFTYFSLCSENISIIKDDNDKKLPKYILKNVTIAFKSKIEINNFVTTRTDFLMEVSFDKILFINKNNYLYINEIIPKSLFFSENNQISQLSYFKEFNNMKETTFIDEKGKIEENVELIPTFLDLSKRYLFKKISFTQKSFNLLTYDLDKILNNLIGKIIYIPQYLSELYKIPSLVINKIEIPLNSMYFEKDILIIENMNTTGDFFYYENGFKLINFWFFNNKTNYAYFEKSHFEINLRKNNIFCDDNLIKKENLFQVLNTKLNELIDTEIKDYYS